MNRCHGSESAARLCQAEKVSIFLREGELYRVAARYGFSREFQQYFEQHPISLDRGSLTGRAILEGRLTHGPLLSGERSIFQVHASRYMEPDQLPPGAVLVIGSGASGAQISEELLRAGRRVYLSVGQHRRIPRRYRGRDLI